MRMWQHHWVTAIFALVCPLAMGSLHAMAEINGMDVSGIENYSSYSGERTFAGKRVGFGGATQPEAMSWLKQQGYVTFISLRLAEEEGAEIEASREAA